MKLNLGSGGQTKNTFHGGGAGGWIISEFLEQDISPLLQLGHRNWCVFHRDHGMKTIDHDRYLSLPKNSYSRQFKLFLA